ncbi:MAG: hypothetical protein R2698_13730 [Microthrixaceae bacterium]
MRKVDSADDGGRAAWWMLRGIALWCGVGLSAGLLILANATSSGRWIVLGGMMLGAASGVGSAVLVGHGRFVAAAALLAVSGLAMPLSFAYLGNLAALLGALAMLLHGLRRRSGGVEGPEVRPGRAPVAARDRSVTPGDPSSARHRRVVRYRT